MRILISAGELSGSMHIASWVKQWRARQVDQNAQTPTHFYGMGGAAMAEAGVQLLINSECELGMIGVSGVFTKLRSLVTAWRTMTRALAEDRPDWLIVVDYAGFNLALARRAKKLGVKVCYYIPPKIWAWRAGRIKRIRRDVDMVAAILPFEADYYAKRGVRAYYVGNPSWQALQKFVAANTEMVTPLALKGLSMSASKKQIALLPGSRQQEVSRLLPAMLEAARRLKHCWAGSSPLHFVLMPAPSIAYSQLQAILARYQDLKVELLKPGDFATLRQCDAAVVASGTATLEVALLGVPMVAIYRLSSFEYQLAKRFVKLPYVTLCNIVAAKPLIKELLQDNCRADRIADELHKLLTDQTYAEQQKAGYQRIRDELGASWQNNLIDLLMAANSGDRCDFAGICV